MTYTSRRLLALRNLRSSCAIAGLTATAIGFGTASQALAQTQAAAAATPSAQAEEIIITGSRVVRDGYEAPTPLTVVSVEQLQEAPRPDLADSINLLPAFAGSTAPQTGIGNVSNGVGGVNALNLRGLGTIRTLVLLDGQRSVGTSANGVVDVSEFPQELVSRVDVVTGGASAAYGSDAISGVVNFILNKEFVGMKGEISGGVTGYGDDRSWKISMSAGTAFGAGKGHFLISGEASHRDGILTSSNRSWMGQGVLTIVNPAYGTAAGQTTTVPQYLSLPNVGFANEIPGGIITTTALKGIAFGPGGTPRQFNYGLVGGTYMQGGDWQDIRQIKVGSLDPRGGRQSLFARASYDVSDSIQAFVQLSWAQSTSASNTTFPFYAGSLVIKADNAFIPAQVATQVAALKITQFNLGTIPMDLYNDKSGLNQIGGVNARTTSRYVIGATGSFEAAGTDWKWDAHYQKGVTHTSENAVNNIIAANILLAIDAVRNPATGTIVCRSTLTNPANGCVPYNPMGIGVNGAAPVNYILGTAHRNQKLTQDNIATAVNGTPFSNWAGPVSLAFGVEWRKETITGAAADPISAVNGFFSGNFQPTFGSYNVTEGFVETVVPLAKEMTWGDSLDLNAAARFTGYSTSGFVSTWKVGATYQAIPDLRFRGTLSRDIRAPNLGDLYSGGTSSSGANTRDPFRGNGQFTIPSFSRGNPTLAPEKALTTGFGGVVQPSFFPGFSASVDYWNIKLDQGIGSLNAQQILDQCYAGGQQFCAALLRDGAGNVSGITVRPFNIATQIRRGIDIEASYNLPLQNVADSMDGSLNFRFLTTKYLKAYSNNNITPATDTVGSVGGDGPPNWVYNASVSYSDAAFKLSVSAHGFSGGLNNNTWIECTSGCPVSTANNPTINTNHLPGAIFFDASTDYKFTPEISAFFSVQNIANKDPIPVPTLNNPTPGVAAANLGLWSGLGRNFRAGVRFKM